RRGHLYSLQIRRERSLRFAARFFSGLPGVFLPEVFQRSPAPAKNIAFGFDDVRHAFRISGARKSAAAIAAVLPHIPGAPWRCRPRLAVVLCEPMPAFGLFA